MPTFKLVTDMVPRGDQPEAIEGLIEGVNAGNRWQTLLGVTGSGKTRTLAGVIERLQRPTLVIAHNKTLAAQLYGEFREFFPESPVRYFVSYYDYYQPEAYVPQTDLYIAKDASINDEIDRLGLVSPRHHIRDQFERGHKVIVSSAFGSQPPSPLEARNGRPGSWAGG